MTFNAARCTARKASRAPSPAPPLIFRVPMYAKRDWLDESGSNVSVLKRAPAGREKWRFHGVCRAIGTRWRRSPVEKRVSKPAIRRVGRHGLRQHPE
ncbi:MULTISPECIES: hypothetical protein [Burkholderia]|uniref:hypothetical protein n=1 Tax=Burkholderia TaxID=32008 RepID=UPI00158E2975|nr:MULTISPECIES: hypothetical protein [Burkholderia]MBY4869065.1 hypothetical protein [Burkholderia anthina]